MAKDKMSFIADTVHGTIRISNIEKEIISSSIFNRLHDISQNSTAYLTFPSNRTKRFEHSIGTMYLAGQMFYYSILNAKESDRNRFFFDLDSIIKQRIEEILQEGNYKYKTELHDSNYKITELTKYSSVEAAFVNSIEIVDEWIPHNIKNEHKYIYFALMQSIRLAALMHDAGHPPFSHIAEYAMRDVWREIDAKEDRSEGENLYYFALKKYFDNGGELHEKIGNKITDRLLQSLLKPMPSGRNVYKQKLPLQLFNVMVKEMTSAILDEKCAIFKSIHSIISGSLDADRLDYVTRDMLNSGLNVGKIEYDRLIPKMKMVVSDNQDGILYYFCPSIKSVNVLEDFFSRRWELYKKIIFHHRVIKTDYLLRECIIYLLKESLKSTVERRQDEKVLPYDISGIWRAVEESSSSDVFFNRLIQWDDGWLMVVLKKAFLQMDDEEDFKKDKFKELLAGEKHYYSFVKKAHMFNEIEKEVVNVMKKSVESIRSQLSDLQANNMIKPFCNDLLQMLKMIQNYGDKFYQGNGFMLGWISRLIFENYFNEEEFQHLVKESVEIIKREKKLNDVIVIFKKIKPGIQENLMLYNNNNDLVAYKNVSNTEVSLKMQQEFVLPFYIYINIDNIDDLDYQEIRKRIGNVIGEKLVKFFKDSIERYSVDLKIEEDV